MRKWGLPLAGSLLAAVCLAPGTAGAQATLTHSRVLAALNPYRYVTYMHTTDGHGGTLGAAEGVSPSNDQLYRFVFWISTREVRTFNFYAARITDAAPDAITVWTGDVGLDGQQAYIVFRWTGSALVASRPLPAQGALLGGTSITLKSTRLPLRRLRQYQSRTTTVSASPGMTPE